MDDTTTLLAALALAVLQAVQRLLTRKETHYVKRYQV
jgi:hypothetical protein